MKWYLIISISLLGLEIKDNIIIPNAYVSFEGKNTNIECPKAQIKRDIEIVDLEKTVKGISLSSWNIIKEISDDLDRESLLKSIETNILYWSSKPQSFSVKIANETYSKEKMLNGNKRLYEIFSSTYSYSDILKILKNEFKIYRAISDDTNTVTITGYYEAEISVSKEKNDDTKYPLHLKPPDLVKVEGLDFDYGRYDENGNLVRYYSTEEIRKGAIDKHNVEFAYSKHPSHIMLAQIQGSAVIRYPDGNFDRIGFDGANGWKYVSVQKILTDCGEIPPMNFRDFIKYLSSQPLEREEKLVNLNPRYIFFKFRDKNQPPYGAISKPLIPHRSIAIDPNYIPYGIVAYISSKKPISDENAQNIIEFKKFSRFVSTHDTGNAIRGAGRIDIFWGNGNRAEIEASSMKANGEFYLIVPK